jgi:hypothetical protein
MSTCNKKTSETIEARKNKFTRIAQLMNIKDFEVFNSDSVTYNLNEYQCLYIYVRYNNVAEISIRPQNTIKGIRINDLYLDSKIAYISFGFNPDRSADDLVKYFAKKITSEVLESHHVYVFNEVKRELERNQEKQDDAKFLKSLGFDDRSFTRFGKVWGTPERNATEIRVQHLNREQMTKITELLKTFKKDK